MTTDHLPRPQLVDSLDALERVPVTHDANPATDPGGVLVFTIHDGDAFPRHLFGQRSDEVLDDPEVRQSYVLERDWGANLVARHLARELGQESYLKVPLARLVLDFGRFPGISSIGEKYLLRHSIFPPLQNLLAEEARHNLLSRYYDTMSQNLVQHFADRRLTLAVHTYDHRNRTGTPRPEVSLVTRSLSYQEMSEMPPFIFDPLFPHILGEQTTHRKLSYQIALDLENLGWPCALDYPYLMPEGSVEIRAQVWFYFRFLRRRFTEAHPHTQEQQAYQRVWQLLLDVVRRSAPCERLRAYLHRYREAPPGSEELFAEARKAYGEIARFQAEHRDELVDGYRLDPRQRPSCLGLEVRKDLLCEMDHQGLPLRLRPDADRVAAEIAGSIAGSVRSYLAELDAEDASASLDASEGNAPTSVELSASPAAEPNNGSPVC